MEVISRHSGVQVSKITADVAHGDSRWSGRGVHLVALYHGSRAQRMVDEILAKAPRYPHASAYKAWPGPNSNTFVEWLSHEISRELAAFPGPWSRDHKYWPPVSRVDDVHGDRNLVCACPPPSDYE